MPLQKLSLQTLGELDAGGVLAFEKLLSRAASDCLDRPNDPTARKITLELEVTPVLEQDLTCSEAKIRFHATAKLPAYRTKERSLGVRQSQGGGMLVFNPDSPDNVHQSTLLPDEGDDE